MPSTTEIFKKYPNEIFLETGTYAGDGVQQALDAGFKKVISIELSNLHFNIVKNRFINNSNVTIIEGDSFKVLPDILKSINTRITFWLDGHYSCGNTALGEYWSPLMQELEIIKSHNINTHTIIIDDMRYWEKSNPVIGFDQNDIINTLKTINCNYQITYEDGAVKNDILIAYI